MPGSAPTAAQTSGRPSAKGRPRVGLFVTCLVDLFRPSVGFAAVKLLTDAGCDVEVPASQTCCGQPAYNSGDKASAGEIARRTIAAFEAYDYVVAPSGSCAGMLRLHYPALLQGDREWAGRAKAFGVKVHELISFLVNVRGVATVDAKLEARATYHDSCSGLRELGVREQPRKLLRSVKGLELVELTDADVCCGFGGTFAVKYPDISNAIVERKAERIADTGADMLLAGDLGCLMNMAGKLSRQGRRIAVRHVAEVLAGELGDPAIGERR
jgi:L-lactate dehydrogenase complex protein LldE